KFKNIEGTSTSPEAIKLACNKASPCERVELSDTSLEYNNDDKQANYDVYLCLSLAAPVAM
ncbi:hypothetical protein MUK42_36773, partial [Musa troglodytarum]